MNGIAKKRVGRLLEEIDERAKSCLDRPIESDGSDLWIGATQRKARRNGRIVSVAEIFVAGAKTKITGSSGISSRPTPRRSPASPVSSTSS